MPLSSQEESIQQFAKQVDVINQFQEILIKGEDEYPFVVHGIDQAFKLLLSQKLLLLPKINAFNNQTLGIFTDFGGEHEEAKCSTYSFLFCSLDSLMGFERRMLSIREQYGLGKREIAAKKYRDKIITKALPDYLKALNNFVIGLSFTVVIDREADANESEKLLIQKLLIENGYNEWSPNIVHKLTTVVHVIAYFISLFTKEGMDVFWMSDEDAVMPSNPKWRDDTLSLLQNTIMHYTEQSFKIGYALPFKKTGEDGREIINERDIKTMDALSCPDIIGGAIEQLLRRSQLNKEGTIPDDKILKRGVVNYPLRWLTEQGVALKKYAIRIGRKNKKFTVSHLSFDAIEDFKIESSQRTGAGTEILSMDW